MSLTHVRSELGIDVGLDSRETAKAVLAGLGCRKGVKHWPSICTVSSKFSTKEKSFRWSVRGRDGLNACSPERVLSF